MTIILFSIAFIFILTSIIIWSVRNGISPMPTSLKAKRCMMSLLPNKVSGKVYELGSGWGTLIFPIAKKYPHSHIIGYETSPLPYWVSKMRCWLGNYHNVTIVYKNFFDETLVDAGLVVCYLYPEAMRRLKDKLTKELPPGTWVASNTFSIPGWQTDKIGVVGDIYYSKIYLYKMR